MLEGEHVGVGGRQPMAQRLLGEQDGRLGGVEDCGEVGGRGSEVERDEDAAGREDRQQGEQGARRARQVDGDRDLRPDP